MKGLLGQNLPLLGMLVAGSSLAATVQTSAPSIKAAHPHEPICLTMVRSLNINATIPSSDYKEVRSRLFETYYLHFKEVDQRTSQFAAHVATLGEGDIVVDLGSGRGLAMLQISTIRPGVIAVAINRQDMTPFYDQLLKLPQHLSKQSDSALQITRIPAYKHLTGGTSPPSSRLESMGEINGVTLGRIYEALGVPSPEWLKWGLPSDYVYDFDTIRKDVTHLIQKLEARIKSGQFQLKTAMAEDVIATYQNSVSMITDVYGAFFYGGERIPLLARSYQALKPGGKAFFYLGEESEYGGDIVTLKDGTTTDLLSYLVQKYPQLTLETDSDGGRFLVMTKTTPNSALDIPLEVTETDYYPNKGNAQSFSVPKLSLKER